MKQKHQIFRGVQPLNLSPVSATTLLYYEVNVKVIYRLSEWEFMKLCTVET